MSALVMGLAARAPVRVDDGAFIATSFPGFTALVNRAAGGEAIKPA
jgi:3-phosphoshikimate 1-carboxyvinyltransferase